MADLPIISNDAQPVVLVDATTNTNVAGVTAYNALKVRETSCSTATMTTVAASTSSVTLLAANTARLTATIFNNSNATLYVSLAATSSATNFTTLLTPSAYYELPVPIYTGVVSGIWSKANGSAYMTEETP
jgi:hypothetical protein